MLLAGIPVLQIFLPKAQRKIPGLILPGIRLCSASSGDWAHLEFFGAISFFFLLRNVPTVSFYRGSVMPAGSSSGSKSRSRGATSRSWRRAEYAVDLETTVPLGGADPGSGGWGPAGPLDGGAAVFRGQSRAAASLGGCDGGVYDVK